MNFRHEYKYILRYDEYLAMKSRLSMILNTDSHALDNKYTIQSLYFDTENNKALLEKISGVDNREKFRIRYYNYDTDNIFIEKKVKHRGLTGKTREKIDSSTVEELINNSVYDDTKSELIQEIRNGRYKPKVIVEYTREPFIYDISNVRITFDTNVRTSKEVSEFISCKYNTIPVREQYTILEVKYDNVLPSVIQSIIQTNQARMQSYSKYTESRLFW